MQLLTANQVANWLQFSGYKRNYLCLLQIILDVLDQQSHSLIQAPEHLLLHIKQLISNLHTKIVLTILEFRGKKTYEELFSKMLFVSKMV